MKYSLVFSIFFCLCSLTLLMDEKNDLIYEFKEEIKDSESLDYRFCLNLKEAYKFYFNKTELNTNLIQDEMKTLFNNFESSQGFGRLTELYKDKFNSKFKDLFYNRIVSNEYFIYKDLICLSSKESELRATSRMNYQLLSLLKISGLYHLFFRDAIYLKDINFYDQNSQVDQIIVQKKPYPYSDCRSNYSSSICYNECFKRKFKLSKYYYANENTTISLDYDVKNVSIIENEKSCFRECKEKEDCKLNYFPSNFKVKNEKSNNTIYRLSYYVATPLIPCLDFWIQFIGLIFLFIDVSLYNVLLYFVECTLVKLKRSKELILAFEFTLSVICLSILLCLAAILFINYEMKAEKPIQKQVITTLSKSEPIGIVICYNAQSLNFTGKTFLDLEKETNKNVENIIEDIYVEFGWKKIRNAQLNVSSKVYFKFDGVSRCLRLDIEPKDPILNSQLLTSKLFVKFKKEKTDCEWTPSLYLSSYNFVYILPADNNFNSETYQVHPDQTYVKKEVKRSSKHGKCIDYDRKKNKKFKCHDQFDCREKCLSVELFRKYSKVIEDTVIDNEQISKEDWSTRKLVEAIDKKDIPEDILIDCETQFFEPSCDETFFESGVSKTEQDYCDRYEFDIKYDVIKLIEEESSIFDLVLNILLLLSIMFGLSVFKLIAKVMKIFKSKPSHVKPKSHLRTNIFPHIICLLGLVGHFWLIFEATLNADLVKSQHYETQSVVEPSDVVFCFNYSYYVGYNDSNFTNNHLTYNRLDKLTKDINIKTVFDRLVYWNESNWTTLDRNLDFKDKNHQISTFYLFDYKCFSLQLNLSYEKESFFFNDYVLKVNFNKSFVENKSVLFFTRQKGTFYLSKFRYLNIYKSRPRSRAARLAVQTYTIQEEAYQITRYNRYLNLINLFYVGNNRKDVDKYMKGLLVNFREEQNLTTLSVPLENNNDTNDLVVDDEKFEYYVKEQDAMERAFSLDTNYDLEFVDHHINTTYFQYFPKEYDFSYSLNPVKRIITETNRENLAKVILFVLSLLSLWLGKNPLTYFVFKGTILNDTAKAWFKGNSKLKNSNKVEASESDQHKASNQVISLKDKESLEPVQESIFKLN